MQNVGRVRVLFLCTLSDKLYICTKFDENILEGLNVLVRTGFSYFVGGVTVLVLCTLSYGGLYLCQVSLIYR